MSREEPILNDELKNGEPTVQHTPDAAGPMDDPVMQSTASDDGVEEQDVSLDVKLEQAETRAGEYLDSLQRERAEFQNYKKRVERDRAEQRERVADDLLVQLLPVLDDFYRALDAVPAEERNQWFEGVSMIQRKLERYLETQNVTEIDALHQEFDPRYHEAVGVDTTTDAESGTVSDVLLRGYMRGDRVLRPAMVRVAE